MFFAPSTLNSSYKEEDLEQRINSILQNQTRFIQLSGQSLPLTLHVDFVLEEFAAKRNVSSNLGLSKYFQIFQNLWTQSLTFQIHLMGEDRDMELAKEFFEGYEFNSEWKYQIFVRYLDLGEWLRFSSENENVDIGTWYDLNEWNESTEFEDELNLLMTVNACRSGQSLTEDIKKAVLEVVKSNANTQFIVDGGWNVDFESNLHNLIVATDSSFWKKF